MPAIISCQKISRRFGALPLFANLDVAIDDGERLGVIGPNGSGKSTLLKILAGVDEPDSGTVSFRKNLRLGYVEQETDLKNPELTIEAYVSRLLKGEGHYDEVLAEAWVKLAQNGFGDLQRTLSSLSGGWKKRLAIVIQLARNPDVLLLDEPTNHLDFASVAWLEQVLSSASFTSIVVTHDRYFLNRVATRILEVNRVYPSGIMASAGNYADFLAKKAAFLAADSKAQDSLTNRVRREEEWLRRGPKARATKSRARIDEAGRLQQNLAEANQRRVVNKAKIDFEATGRKTKRLLTGVELTMSLGGRKLFNELSILLEPETRLGLLGQNGSGKSTLLKVLGGSIKPDSGRVEYPEGIKVVYFDQLRKQLDLSLTLKRALSPDGDQVIFQGRGVHVASWAKRFAFDTSQLDVPLSKLSGGEQARVLIASLMAQPADVLLLDEPTNDLDIPTLESLEDSLLDFPGAIVLVTHDRYLLSRVCTNILSLNGNGMIQEYADYEQWEAESMRDTTNSVAKARSVQTAQAALSTASSPAGRSNKNRLSYKEQREWDGMEQAIADAEAQLMSWQEKLDDPKIGTNAAALKEASEASAAAQAEVERLYVRWSELEGKQSQ